MKVYILVEVFQLVIDDVKVFADLNEAKDHFKAYTKMDYDEFCRRLDADPDLTHEELIGDCEGTQIYELDFTPKGIQICEYESVHCPYCGGINLKEMRKTNVRISMNHPPYATHLNQHELHCLDCAGTFWIPCED